jgi:hypothetical protein
MQYFPNRLKTVLLLIMCITTCYSESNKIPDKFINMYNEGKYAEITQLFSYPPNQNLKTHYQDSLIFNGLFSIIHQKWGKILSWEPGKNDTALYASISLSSDDSSYWNHQIISDTIKITAVFAKNDTIIISFKIPKNDKNKIGYMDIDKLYKRKPSPEDIIKFKKLSEEMQTNFQIEFNELMNQAMLKINNQKDISEKPKKPH